MTNLKKYNLFIIITSFTKLLVEVFIPLLLFDMGFSFKEILIFLLIQYITILILSLPAGLLGQKIRFKNLLIMSSILFSLTYIYLNFMGHTILKLIILSILNGTYLITYWISRHIYGISIIEDKKTTDNVTQYSIFAIIGSLPASLIGAIILNKLGYLTLSIIILVLSLISIIPLAKIKHTIKTNKISLKNILKTYPAKNYLFYFLDQLKFIAITFFPLYIFQTITKRLEYIGITNIIVGISSIIYIHIISKKMEKNKKNYMNQMMLFLFITLLIKLNVSSKIMMLIVIFIEGIFKSALDTIILRNTYSYSKDYDNSSYIVFMEMLYSIFRIIILSIYIIFNLNIKLIIYIGTFSLLINTFIKFKEGKNGYNIRNY